MSLSQGNISCFVQDVFFNMKDYYGVNIHEPSKKSHFVYERCSLLQQYYNTIMHIYMNICIYVYIYIIYVYLNEEIGLFF